MRRKHVTIIGAICLAVMIGTIRIEYHRFNWGGYWSVDFVPPWR